MDLIYLNGASSSGKTSIARELQVVLSENYLYLGIDAFMEMMPARSNIWDTHGIADGFSWKRVDLPDGNTGMQVVAGNYGEAIEAAFVDVAVTLLRANIKLIVDNVIDGSREQFAWKERLAGFQVCFVGVTCPLPELERREKSRGDRVAGSASEQHYRTHAGVQYDVVVDTMSASSRECAVKIADYISSV